MSMGQGQAARPAAPEARSVLEATGRGWPSHGPRATLPPMRSTVARILKVNHGGEHSASRIYARGGRGADLPVGSRRERKARVRTEQHAGD